MKMTLKIFAAFLMALTLGGCSRLLEHATDRPSVDFAQDTIRAIATGNVEASLPRFADSLHNDRLEANVRALSAQYLQVEPTEIDLVSFQTMVDAKGNARRGYLFDSLHGDTHVSTHVTVVGSADALKIVEMTAQKANPAALASATWTSSHYLCAGVALLNLGVVGTALVRWFRTRRAMSRQWAWLAAILLGTGGITFNWSTGYFEAFTPWRILAFSAALGRDAGGPWRVELALPLGAILFLCGVTTRFAARTTSPLPQ